jgi:small subunit ribosomal protein S24e
MELKIINKKKNELLGRTEVTAEMHEKTIPTKQQIRDKMSALLNSKPEEIAITKVETKFGSPKAKIYARAYPSVEDLKKKEPKYVVERNFGKEKKENAAENTDAPANFKK